MQQLTPGNLYSLENYATIRDDFRAEIMAHVEKGRPGIL